MSRFGKAVMRRVDTILDDDDLTRIYKRFGIGVFTRSSVFDGLRDILNLIDTSGTCLEIGTRHGVTAVVLSRYFDEVISIDIVDKTRKHDIVEHLGINNIRFIDVQDNKDKQKVIADLDFDFAFIDGDHEKDTRLDFALVRRCGRILFHEYGTNEKVTEFVNEYGKPLVRGSFAYLEL